MSSVVVIEGKWEVLKCRAASKEKGSGTSLKDENGIMEEVRGIKNVLGGLVIRCESLLAYFSFRILPFNIASPIQNE